VDGKYIKGSSILQTVVDLYEQIRKEGQDALKSKREILASEQIDVSSNYILNKPL
jgi:predicted transcriptional regulator